MNNLTSAIDKLLAWLITLLFAALLGCVLWQVISRYLLPVPSTVTDELARLLFIWTGLLGSAYAAGKKKHLAIDLLAHSVSHRSQKKLKLLLEMLTMVFAFIVLIIGGGRLVAVVLDSGQLSPAMEIPMGWVYMVIPVSGLLMLFYSLVTILKHLSPRT